VSIRRAGNRWQVRVRIGGGLRVERTVPAGGTQADARALEAQIRRAHIDAAVGRRPKYTIDQALDRWIETSAKRLRSWERDLKYRTEVLREYTARHTLESLVEVAENVTATGQREGMSAPTINRYVALLRRVGNLAERWGWTDKPLGRRVALLPERSERHVYLTPRDVARLAAKADALTADMIRFAALTGLRRGELLPLQPHQVRDGLLVLDANTKSGRPRGIPLPPRAAAIARARLPWGVSIDQLRARFIVARKKAKLPNVRWHDLRHTYASWIVQAGQPLTAVRDLLGHSSLAVTNRYAHLSPAHLHQAVSVLPAFRVGKRRGKRTRTKVA
jgi:integrase